MIKSVLLLLTLVPVIVGYLVNVLIMVPIIGMAGFYLLPLCTTAFWIYLGKQYARKWKTIPAVLIAHIVGGGAHYWSTFGSSCWKQMKQGTQHWPFFRKCFPPQLLYIYLEELQGWWKANRIMRAEPRWLPCK